MTGPPVMRWDLLNDLLSVSEQRRYLEIGIQNGICGARIRASQKWGVDPEPRTNARGKYTKVFRLTSDRFFECIEPDRQFDVIFVDGLHHAEQTLRDVDNALRHLAPGGTIVMHDCNPQSELAQRVPRETGVWNGDCWKAMVRLRSRRDVHAFTIDTDHGLGVVIPRPNPDPLTGIPETLRYEHLERDRQRLLGLIPPSKWKQSCGPGLLGRVVVASAIFGGRDQPRRMPGTDADEYVLFTDGHGAPGWRVERMPEPKDPRLAAREIKTLLLEKVEADVVVWIDGRIRLTGRPLRPLLIRALAETDVAGYPHPWRTGIYEEALECATLGLAPRDAIDSQVAAYEADGHPPKSGLWNTMVLARRRTPRMIEFGRAWWHEIQTRTVRDQISFPYLLRKFGIDCGVMGVDVYREGSSLEFSRGRHLA